jgi:two-component system, sensor histidine kinase and response regulator
MPQHATSNNIRILLVDDNQDNRTLSLRQLQKLGYSASIAIDGDAALEALSLSEYDIVLMDCEMPKMDGYSAAAEFRRREGSLKHTIVVAMTAHPVDFARDKCIEAGMDDCINKSIKLDALKLVLEHWTVKRFGFIAPAGSVQDHASPKTPHAAGNSS